MKRFLETLAITIDYYQNHTEEVDELVAKNESLSDIIKKLEREPNSK